MPAVRNDRLFPERAGEPNTRNYVCVRSMFERFCVNPKACLSVFAAAAVMLFAALASCTAFAANNLATYLSKAAPSDFFSSADR
ncbi:hypothetical protein ABTE28_20245, partial [Acinetobacter baumannii]